MARTRRPSANPLLVVAYLRVSTDEQHLGPVAQQEAIDRWCEANGAQVVAVCRDLGVSGGAPLDKRPGLIAALDAIAEHGAGVLLVAKRDRLARDPLVASMVEAGAKRHGARIVSAAGEGTDADDPTAILMRRIVDAFAEYERLVIKARTRSALSVKRSRGERVGQVPFGFRLAGDGQHIEPKTSEQKVVQLVRELREDGLSIRAIAQRLNEEGVPARGKCWHPTTIKRLLDREVA